MDMVKGMRGTQNSKFRIYLFNQIVVQRISHIYFLNDDILMD